MAVATIVSELELVNLYKSVGDTDKAKARQLNTVTKDHLGEEHDSTFRYMASLSTLFWTQVLSEKQVLSFPTVLRNIRG